MNRQRAAAAQDEVPGARPVVTPEIAAEAAVWIARLHGPDRSTQMERECREWQDRSAAHRLAFERCTDTWEDVPRVTLVNAYASARPNDSLSGAQGRNPRGGFPRWAVALVVAGLVLGGAVFAQLWRGMGAYSTGVGEQQLVVLDDGTRMSLNTDTRARVDFDSSRRTVTVERGEALFEVAKDPRRPFVVRVADSEVVAHGTVFSVRLGTNATRADNALAVTLIEGQVTVRPAPGGDADGVAPAQPLMMEPGERVQLVKAAGRSAGGPATLKVDRPRIDQVVAWKRAEAIFDDVSLADAVAEMNRYNRTPIVLVGDASLAQLRVSGLYRTGDSLGFVRAVAALHGLVVREDQGRLELASAQ